MTDAHKIARCVRGCTTDAQYQELTANIEAALASAEALNERLLKFVRECAGTRCFGHTPLYVTEACALLASIEKGDGRD